MGDYGHFATLRAHVGGGVATVSLDNGPFNIMDGAMIGDLDRLSRAVWADDRVKAVVLQSLNPDFFVAHADLTVVRDLPPFSPPQGELLGGVLDRFRLMPKATIAKIEGICRGGGGELALACDMRFAAIGKATLCQPEVGLGITTGAGAAVRLPRLAGRARALEILLGCGDFTAELAERYGYVNRALPADAIGPFVEALAQRIAGFPGSTIAALKQIVAGAEIGLVDQLALEERLFLGSVHATGRERMAAALSAGLQTPEVENGPIEALWRDLA